MEKGFSVVLGMTIAYAVSFFGLLLAYIVYQRNHHKDNLWRLRPIGVSFFAAVYGYILPLLIVANAFLTLLVKVFRGMEYNYLIWTDRVLILTVPAAVLLFWLLGKLLWRMKSAGYASALATGIVLTATMAVVLGKSIAGGGSLHLLGAYATAALWHMLWVIYFFSGNVRRAFFSPRS
ncbi:MAG: hypothetical protein JXQ83_12585 [Candidatus Glassbacteria bacterium]|nr:hypothetical protein [Candidatus Glassbacteria bacterium]